MDKLKQHIQNNLTQLDIDHPKEDLWNALSGEIKQTENRDSLKDHIEQNKDEFDLETPGEKSWSNIESLISRHKPVLPISTKKLGWYVAAASLVLFIVVGALLYKNRTSAIRNGDDIVTTPPKTELTVPKLLLVDTIKEVAPAEKKNIYVSIKMKVPVQKTVNKKLPSIIIQTQAEYDNLIAGQVSLIQSTPMYGESAGDFEGFIDDFKRLDKQEKRLRTAVMQKGMEENTLNELAMIYQKKLTVLKMLQGEIGKTGNNLRSETDTIPVFIKL